MRRSGHQVLSIRHARVCIAIAPWITPYKKLAACLLPMRMVPPLIRCFTGLQRVRF
jgi:hypothetical protein